MSPTLPPTNIYQEDIVGLSPETVSNSSNDREDQHQVKLVQVVMFQLVLDLYLPMVIVLEVEENSCPCRGFTFK